MNELIQLTLKLPILSLSNEQSNLLQEVINEAQLKADVSVDQLIENKFIVFKSSELIISIKLFLHARINFLKKLLDFKILTQKIWQAQTNEKFSNDKLLNIFYMMLSLDKKKLPTLHSQLESVLRFGGSEIEINTLSIFHAAINLKLIGSPVLSIDNNVIDVYETLHEKEKLKSSLQINLEKKAMIGNEFILTLQLHQPIFFNLLMKVLSPKTEENIINEAVERFDWNVSWFDDDPLLTGLLTAYKKLENFCEELNNLIQNERIRAEEIKSKVREFNKEFLKKQINANESRLSYLWHFMSTLNTYTSTYTSQISSSTPQKYELTLSKKSS